jgi:hypothetical protein
VFGELAGPVVSGPVVEARELTLLMQPASGIAVTTYSVLTVELFCQPDEASVCCRGIGVDPRGVHAARRADGGPRSCHAGS